MKLRAYEKGIPFGQIKHGEAKTRLYRIWVGMKMRTLNPDNHLFNLYGGRGIKVCEDWNDKDNGFVQFREWALNNGYKEDLSIDRIDVNGDYEPSNCRWVDNYIQQNNRRNVQKITVDGETHTAPEWDRIKGYRVNTVRKRVDAGWSGERAVNEPVHTEKRRTQTGKTRTYVVLGEEMSLNDICRRFDINERSFINCIKKYNMSPDEIILVKREKGRKTRWSSIC